MRSIRPGLLTTDLAALAAGVQPATIRDWKRRGILTPASGTDRHPLYAVADIRQAQRTLKPRRVTDSSRDHDPAKTVAA